MEVNVGIFVSDDRIQKTFCLEKLKKKKKDFFFS